MNVQAGAISQMSPRRPWSGRQLLFALALVAAGVASMWSTWRDWGWLSYTYEEHSHVFLVIPFAAAIIYVNREKFARLPAQVGMSWAGPAVVGMGLLMAYDGYHHARGAFWHMGAVLVALGCGVTVLGWRVVVRFWPAFLLLGFMVPMPSTLRLKIAFPLQSGMAATTQWVVGLFGADVGRQGNLLTINGESVAVAEACNGLRMVWTLILVSWLFAFVTPIKGWVRWTVVLLSPLTALVCNVIRLIPTLLLYGHADKQVAEKFHDAAGWGMVPLSFFMLMGVISLIEAFGVDVRQRDSEGDDGGGGETSVSPRRRGGAETEAKDSQKMAVCTVDA